MRRTMNKGISFVLPTYNSASLLSVTLDSLIRQKLDHKEIIVVDDGSTDSTPQLLEWYKEKYWVPRKYSRATAPEGNLSVFRFKERRGAAFCRNYGNKHAYYDIISVCDAGDIYHEDKAALVVHAFKKKRPKVDIFSHAVRNVDSKYRDLKIQFPRPFTGAPGEKPSISHPSVCYRKDVIRKVKYREDSLHTDQYERFLIEAARAGFKFGYTNRVLMMKLYAPEYRDYRNIEEARKIKKATYEEFGIELPDFLKYPEAEFYATEVAA